MTKIAERSYSNLTSYGNTAAAGFHLSDTLDWSSLSARTKNRVIVVDPAYVVSPNQKTLDPAPKDQKSTRE